MPNEISRPESVIRLRNLRKTMGLSVNQVVNMVNKAGANISESTVRRFFNDEVPPETNWRIGTFETVSDVLLGTDLGDYDASEAMTYYKELKEQKILLKEYDRSTSELENKIAEYSRSIQRAEDIIKFLMDEVVFLRKRLEYISPEKPEKK